MKKVAQFLLKGMARSVLAKYRPIVVAVTGSVGKTTTKDAVAHILAPHLLIRASEKNFNNEIGVPLTILGCDAPGRSLLRWASIAFRFLVLMMVTVRYPKVLVLEMGIDRPGDMGYLLSIVMPAISVVTGISSSHLEFFETLDAIAREKGALVSALPPEGMAILNADDGLVWKMRRLTHAHVEGFGFSRRATFRAFNERVLYTEKGIRGIHFKVQYEGKTIPIRLKHCIAKHHLGALLAALSVANALKVNILDVVRTAENFRPSPGRFQYIAGKNGALLFDDTYNASPASTIAALRTFGEMPVTRKILALGDMLELGTEEVSGHASLVKEALKIHPSILVLVGKRMARLQEEFRKEGAGQIQVYACKSPEKAAAILAPLLRSHDGVLIKGSQGMRMERVVERLMHDPECAEKMLCRQSPRWKEIPFLFP